LKGYFGLTNLSSEKSVIREIEFLVYLWLACWCLYVRSSAPFRLWRKIGGAGTIAIDLSMGKIYVSAEDSEEQRVVSIDKFDEGDYKEINGLEYVKYYLSRPQTFVHVRGG
jgi:hypothetical protein